MKLVSFKNIFNVALLSVLALGLFACGKSESKVETVNETRDIFDFEQNVNNRRIAVAYFSIDDDVKDLAEKFKEALDADLIEIVPEVPYTKDDLDFDNETSRVKLEDEFNPFDSFIAIDDEEYETSEGIVIATNAIVEKKQKITELPKIKLNNANRYPIIVVGFPIWYENAPKVIYTFMQKLKNKVVVPFCTGSEMGQVDQYLSNITDDSVQVMSGRKFDKSVSVEEIKDWVTILSADFDSH